MVDQQAPVGPVPLRLLRTLTELMAGWSLLDVWLVTMLTSIPDLGAHTDRTPTPICPLPKCTQPVASDPDCVSLEGPA